MQPGEYMQGDTPCWFPFILLRSLKKDATVTTLGRPEQALTANQQSVSQGESFRKRLTLEVERKKIAQYDAYSS